MIPEGSPSEKAYLGLYTSAGFLFHPPAPSCEGQDTKPTVKSGKSKEQ